MQSFVQLRALSRAGLPRPRRGPLAPLAVLASQYHQTSALRQPYKDDQDRESLKPKSSQGTKSGTDDDIAAHSDTAFNPDKTGPEHEKQTAGQGQEGNPLEFSGANQELSKPQGGEPDKKKLGGSDKDKKSGGGSGQKHGNAS